MATKFLLKFLALSSPLLLIGIICVSNFISLSQSSSYESPSYSRRHSKKVQYGSACNSSVKCDIYSLLTCEENTCQCLYQDAMSYSPEVGTCVSLVNEVCGYLETKQVFINCVPNSLCDQNQGVCRCIQGFVESDRECVKQKDFGEPCHSDSECLSDLSLICFEEVCQCDPERYVPLYSKDEDLISSQTRAKCVALAGLPCTAKTGCVPKASCMTMSDTGNILSSAHSWMHSGICDCDPGYIADLNGYCRGKYGSNCDVLANVTCSERFHCFNGICNCKYPDDQVYDEREAKCVSLTGGPCEVGDGNETDVLNLPVTASCGKFSECRNGSCVCKDGFVENKERGCDLTFGQPCTGQTMSKCDKAAGLHCINGKCACKDDMRLFDEAVGKCVGRVGASCTLADDECDRKQSGGLGSGRRAESLQACGKDAICHIARAQLSGTATYGVCKKKIHDDNQRTTSNGAPGEDGENS